MSTVIHHVHCVFGGLSIHWCHWGGILPAELRVGPRGVPLIAWLRGVGVGGPRVDVGEGRVGVGLLSVSRVPLGCVRLGGVSLDWVTWGRVPRSGGAGPRVRRRLLVVHLKAAGGVLK